MHYDGEGRQLVVGQRVLFGDARGQILNARITKLTAGTIGLHVHYNARVQYNQELRTARFANPLTGHVMRLRVIDAN